jgi:ABC-2 type transport system permease protein
MTAHALVRKDLRASSPIAAVVLTLAIPSPRLVLGSPFSGAGDQSRHALPGHGGSGRQRSVQATGRGPAADKALAVTQPSLEEARAAVLAGRLSVAVVIPAGFGDAAVRAFIGQGRNADLELLTDPSKGAEVAMVRGLLTGHMMGAVTQEAFTGASSQRLLDDGIKSLETSDMPADQRELLRRVFASCRR